MELFDALTCPPRAPALQQAIDAMAATDENARGAVFTKRVVVDAILDLVGYTSDQPLHERRLLEPSFGDGDFILPALERLLRAFELSGGRPNDAKDALLHALMGVELHPDSVGVTRTGVLLQLQAFGVNEEDAQVLAGTWLRQDDFLLTELGEPFDVVVGNPPYVRQERIPAPLLTAYRRRFRTVYDRADLYVPFYERGLRSLRLGGRLGFICSDRWLKNRYGGPLRELVAEEYSLRHFIDMVNVEAFTTEVIAYPAITVIERGPSPVTRIARRPQLEALQDITRAMLNGGPKSSAAVEEATEVVRGRDPWLLDSAEELELVRAMERRLPTLEEAGCRVGIGVATGADRIYTGTYDELPVEQDRKLRLVLPADIRAGVVTWGGRGVVNPFEDDGTLAKLEEYPAFAAFLTQHEQRLKARHVAKKSPERWYRTIDRIHNDLVMTEKLLIPDIKGGAEVGYDPGGLYPHHNLYFIVSDTWDLRVLQAILRSSIALFFVNAYSVKMSGGFLRFQAQYLRRIRLPGWSSLTPELRERLAALACHRDLAALDEVVFEAYPLQAEQRKLISRVAAQARVGST